MIAGGAGLGAEDTKPVVFWFFFLIAGEKIKTKNGQHGRNSPQ